jgi:glycosyltransferase involved in cell wall biosynthesis
MRLLYVIDSLFPGGSAQSLAAMAPYLVAHGVQLEVAYLVDRPGLRGELEQAGARVLPVGGDSRLGWTVQLVQLLRRRRPDLVHTTLFEADLCGRIAARLTDKPVVSSLVNVAYGPEQLSDPRLTRWKLRAAQRLDAITARGVTRFHAVTRQVSEVMARRLRIPRDRIEVVPRGRDPQVLGTRTPERRQRVRADLGLNHDTKLVVAVGRQEHQKGYDVLLEALRLALRDEPHLHLYIAGREGSATPRLRALARRLKLDRAVTFLGPRGDVPELLSASDAFALSSRWEGMPGVVLEAMALEVPIVATGLPAVRDVLEDGRCGLLVTAERPMELAVAMVSAVRNPDASRKTARLARERFLHHYTIDRVADQMLAFYGRALEQNRRPWPELN